MSCYFVVVRFKQGPDTNKVKIWKEYDQDYTWGSPAYTILGYADTFAEAKAIRKEGKTQTV